MAFGLLSACTTAPSSQPNPSEEVTRSGPPPANPEQWAGRWYNGEGAVMTLMPMTGNRYHITLRSNQGITSNYRATPSGGKLLFQRGEKTLSLQPAPQRKNNNTEPASSRTYCLATQPGGKTYCRDPNTAEGLPLKRGAYVAVKSRCSAAKPTQTLYFDGHSLSRPGQKTCHSRIVWQRGIIFHLRDDCARGLVANSNRPNETISIPDAKRLSLHPVGQEDTLYRYCATRSLPPSLQQDSP